jgi:hypothetical protein
MGIKPSVSWADLFNESTGAKVEFVVLWDWERSIFLDTK